MSNLYVSIFGGSLSDFTPAPKSQIVTVYRGVAIYRIENSRYWYVRTWDRHRRKYVVRSTKETHKIPALKFAQNVGLKLLSSQTVSEEKSAFKTFAYQLLSIEKVAADSGNRSVGSYKAMVWCIHNSDWGLLKVFGDTDGDDGCGDANYRTDTTAQIGALTTAQTQALGINGAAALTTTQVKALSTADVVALTQEQVKALGTKVSSLTTSQTAVMETRDVASLTTAQIQAMTTTQIVRWKHGSIHQQ